MVCFSVLLCVYFPSSKQKLPTFQGSGLRTTYTRGRNWLIHIGRYSTTREEYVNGKRPRVFRFVRRIGRIVIASLRRRRSNLLRCSMGLLRSHHVAPRND